MLFVLCCGRWLLCTMCNVLSMTKIPKHRDKVKKKNCRMRYDSDFALYVLPISYERRNASRCGHVDSGCFNRAHASLLEPPRSPCSPTPVSFRLLSREPLGSKSDYRSLCFIESFGVPRFYYIDDRCYRFFWPNIVCSVQFRDLKSRFFSESFFARLRRSTQSAKQMPSLRHGNCRMVGKGNIHMYFCIRGTCLWV
jgi:hypothetical protein